MSWQPLGGGQLQVLGERVAARRRNFAYYRQALGYLPGLESMPEAAYGRSTLWLTCLTIDSKIFGYSCEEVRRILTEQRIESRLAWKPLHLQPLFSGCEVVGGRVAESIFAKGICLPSGSSLQLSQLERIVEAITQIQSATAYQEMQDVRLPLRRTVADRGAKSGET